jgi:hypothetical protein
VNKSFFSQTYKGRYFKGEFKRLPLGWPTKNNFVEVPLGWIAVRHDWVVFKKDRRVLTGRLYRIRSQQGFTTYRFLRLMPNLKGARTMQPAEIVMDWDGWLDLSGRPEEVPDKLELEFSPVPRLLTPVFFTKHPDPTHRLAATLAWFSVMLTVAFGLVTFFQ